MIAITVKNHPDSGTNSNEVSKKCAAHTQYLNELYTQISRKQVVFGILNLELKQ